MQWPASPGDGMGADADAAVAVEESRSLGASTTRSKDGAEAAAMAFAAGAEGAALGSPLREDHFASHCHDVRPADCEVLVPDAPVDPSSVRGRLLVLGAVYEEASPFDFDAYAAVLDGAAAVLRRPRIAASRSGWQRGSARATCWPWRPTPAPRRWPTRAETATVSPRAQ